MQLIWMATSKMRTGWSTFQ